MTRAEGRQRAPRSFLLAVLEALAVAALAALAWALMKGILEFGAGLLGVAVVVGWGIGALLGRRTPAHCWLPGSRRWPGWGACC